MGNLIFSALEGLQRRTGYRDEHDQWIAETGLPHTKKVIEDYWIKISSQNL